jgi:hypothetical protein
MVDIIIVSYEMVNRELSFLSKIAYLEMILDEAHRLKNVKSMTLKKCSEITADTKVLLTGTPVQNSLQELWALLYFCDPGKFRSPDQFQNCNDDEAALETIGEMTSPQMLRRKKGDSNLPIGVQEETIVEVELTQVQRMIHKMDKHRDKHRDRQKHRHKHRHRHKPEYRHRDKHIIGIGIGTASASAHHRHRHRHRHRHKHKPKYKHKHKDRDRHSISIGIGIGIGTAEA